MVDRRSKSIGYFDNEIDAARACGTAGIEHHEFAALNYPSQ
jgi:hypothetical protein